MSTQVTAVFSTVPSTPILHPDEELVNLGGFAWTSQGIMIAVNNQPDSTLTDYFS